jgi:hypothetical protein
VGELVGVWLGLGVAVALGVGLPLGLLVPVALGVGVQVAEGDDVGVSDGVAEGVGLAVTVGVGVALTDADGLAAGHFAPAPLQANDAHGPPWRPYKPAGPGIPHCAGQVAQDGLRAPESKSGPPLRDVGFSVNIAELS